MKTTVELPTDLLRRVKARAAEQGRSMKALITEALEQTFRGGRQARKDGWRVVFGRAPKAAVREVDRRIAQRRQPDPKDR